MYESSRAGRGDKGEKDKKAYRAVKGSFNTNSMTLYLGMKKCGNRQEISDFKHCKNFCCTSGLNRVGCLYMGDYDASGNYKWKSLTDAYKEYWDSIGCVQIPHHGSQYNYNKELSKIDAYFIISAGINNRYHHPHNVVIKDLLFNGRVPFIVSENKSSEVHLLVEI